MWERVPLEEGGLGHPGLFGDEGGRDPGTVLDEAGLRNGEQVFVAKLAWANQGGLQAAR